jgi:phospholipase C
VRSTRGARACRSLSRNTDNHPYEIEAQAAERFRILFHGTLTSEENRDWPANFSQASREMRRLGPPTRSVAVVDEVHARERTVHSLAPGERLIRRFALERSFGWYDVTLRVDPVPAFRRQVAGRLETGQDSMSDPLLGR